MERICHLGILIVAVLVICSWKVYVRRYGLVAGEIEHFNEMAEQKTEILPAMIYYNRVPKCASTLFKNILRAFLEGNVRLSYKILMKGDWNS